jgi:hypothetical protein
MHGLSAAGILAAWEAGEWLGPLDRALTLLRAAGEDGELADLPLAERDRRLLTLRRETFGEQPDCVASCPGCGEELEFALSCSELAEALGVRPPEMIELAGGAVSLRPLYSRDLAQAVALPAADVALFLCSRACPEIDELPPESLPEVRALVEAREAAGEICLSLACPGCGSTWPEVLDVPAHIWHEVEATAWHVMTEIAEIAGAFGWSEADILALSERRRRGYLAIARGG